MALYRRNYAVFASNVYTPVPLTQLFVVILTIRRSTGRFMRLVRFLHRHSQSPTICNHGYHHLSQSHRQPSFCGGTPAGGRIFIRVFGIDIHVPQRPAIGSRDQELCQEKVCVALAPTKAGFGGAGIPAGHSRRSASRSAPCFLP